MLLSKNKIPPLPIRVEIIWKSESPDPANTKVFGHHLINFCYNNNCAIAKFTIVCTVHKAGSIIKNGTELKDRLRIPHKPR